MFLAQVCKFMYRYCDVQCMLSIREQIENIMLCICSTFLYYQVVLSEVDAIRLSSRCRGHVHNARFLSGVRIKAAVTCSNVHGYGALHVTRVDFSMH